MSENTKENPGCRHSMIKYCSELSGLPLEREKIFYSIDDLYSIAKKGKKKGKLVLNYASWSITVVSSNGTKSPFMYQGIRFDAKGIEAHHFIVRVPRNIAEFGIKSEYAGTYKDSLGGGWHQTVGLFKINDQFFAPQMECAD